MLLNIFEETMTHFFSIFKEYKFHSILLKYKSNIVNIFTVTFDQFNASVLTK